MALTDDDKGWIKALLQEQLAEHLETLETRLLTEFHKWASPAEIRQRGHREAIHALEIDVEGLKDRVKTLEDAQHGQT